jgi:hypothetical protein
MGVSRRMRMGRGGWEGRHGVVRATLCTRRARAIVSVRARGLIKGDLGAGVYEVAAFGEMRRSYQAMVEAERRAGRPLRCHTTLPNEGHKYVWGPRISSAAGNWFIATQWQGDSAFPPGYLNADLLYALSKTFNTLFYIGFALFAVATVLVIAGVATREKPLGFQVVAINWVLLAASWLVIFIVVFVIPYPGGD